MGSTEHTDFSVSSETYNQSSKFKIEVETELTKLNERIDRDPKKDMETVKTYESETKFTPEEGKFLKIETENLLMEIINKHYTSNDVGYYESPFNANNWGTGNHLVEYSKYIIGIDTAKFQHYTFNHAGQINLYGKLNNNKERTKLAQYLNAKYRLLMYGVDTGKVQQKINDIYKQHNIRIRFLGCGWGENYNPTTLTQDQKIIYLEEFLKKCDQMTPMMQRKLQGTFIYIGESEGLHGNVYNFDNIEGKNIVKNEFLNHTMLLSIKKEEFFEKNKVYFLKGETILHEAMHKYNQLDKQKNDQVFTNIFDSCKRREIETYKGKDEPLFNTQFLKKIDNYNNAVYEDNVDIEEAQSDIYVSSLISLFVYKGDPTDTLQEHIANKYYLSRDDFRPKGYVSTYCLTSPGEDIAETSEWLLKGNRELLHIMQEDPIVRKKVEALTGYNYDINQQKFTSKISDQDYKKRFGTERQFFGKFDPTLTAEYRNKKFNL